MAQCTARSKQQHRQCRQSAMKGRTVCQHHGGKSLRGLAAPNYKTGKYSADLPAKMASAYLQARTDPELHSLRDEIALAETRVHELLQRLPDSGPGPHDTRVWQAIGHQIDRLSRLRLAEHKRLMDLQLVITQDQANVLLGALVAIVMEALQQHIPDVQQVRRIYSAISQGLDVHLQLDRKGAEA